MPDVLLITDDVRRGERLARNLSGSGKCRVHNLYGDMALARSSGVIVADVEQLNSEAVVRLRRCLSIARARDGALLFLARGNIARVEAQARLLGASEVLPAQTMMHDLQTWLARLDHHDGGAPASVGATRGARRAELFLRGPFIERPISADAAGVGTAIITDAVIESGIREWVAAVQRFDDATHRHILLVAGLAAAFAGALGLGERDGHHLARAALLHDVGKTAIPSAILNKPGRLDPEELAVMRTHAVLGHAMLTEGGFDTLTLAVARSHHEMLDGSGYPDSLQGGQIPDLVRLVTICDIYAALIERRSYKPAMTGAAAFAILEGMAGRLDADLVRAFRPIADAFSPRRAVT